MKSDFEKRYQQEQQLFKLIEGVDGKERFLTNLENFVDNCLCVFCENPTTAEAKKMQKYLKNEKAAQAIKLLGELSCDYHDAFGEIFMKHARNNNNQTFTPEHICELMAQIAGDSESNKVYDSCCGTGRLLLGALKKARRKNKRVQFVGTDIDPLCVKITVLNMCLQTAEGVFRVGDSSTQTYSKSYVLTRHPVLPVTTFRKYEN